MPRSSPSSIRPCGKMDVGATTQALLAAKPDAILNGMFGVDLPKFVREASCAGCSRAGRSIPCSPAIRNICASSRTRHRSAGSTTGWPYYAIERPENVAFVKTGARSSTRSRARLRSAATTPPSCWSPWSTRPGRGYRRRCSVVDGLRFSSPAGEITMRGIDSQGNAPVYIGTVELVGGEDRMNNIHEIDTAPYLATEEEIRAVRPVD